MKRTSTEEKVLKTMSEGIRIAVVGNVDAGKSTLIGTLLSSTLDNGKGSNRVKVAKHKHEVETGRTSSVCSHLIGFDDAGQVIIPNNSKYDDSRVANEATRTVTLMDMAGHERYLRTTIDGISKGVPDYALVLVNAGQAPTHMTIKHLNLCILSGIPVIIVLTKIDTCPSHVFRNTKKELQEIMRSPSIDKRMYAIKNKTDIELVKDKLHSLAPVIQLSCVSGEGLDVLKSMLFNLPKRRHHANKMNRPFEFLIEDTFSVTGVGLVISGFVNAGQYNKGDTLHIGPLKDGSFIKTSVKSVHVAQTLVSKCWAGHSACFAIGLSKEHRKLLRKQRGMVALKEIAPITRNFTAEVCLLKGESVTMKVGTYSTTVHILHLKRAVRLIKAEVLDEAVPSVESNVVLRPGQHARMTFQFKHPEYIRKGMRVLLREGQIRGIGIIVSCN